MWELHKKNHTEVSTKWHNTTKSIADVKANDSMREFTILHGPYYQYRLQFNPVLYLHNILIFEKYKID